MDQSQAFGANRVAPQRDGQPCCPVGSSAALAASATTRRARTCARARESAP